MCGLVGFLRPGGISGADASLALRKMSDSIKHRGPDDAGEWLNLDAGIALGHRRLAIIDRTVEGHQPMVSKSSRFILAFNGEIYNHLEIRQALRHQAWRGHSDTETVLAAVEEWGIERALQKSVGMFAIALWDNSERRLVLARDRIGEKPLYFGWQKGTFLFASELKALEQHQDFQRIIDPSALASYVRNGYVPSPHSIYQGIGKLPPGSILEVKAATCLVGEPAEPRPYWTLAHVIGSRSGQRFADPNEAVEALEAQLMTAIKQQQLSDVPLGAFLSGGIDSSIVVALMQSMSTAPVKTFTIGFQEESYDEAAYARQVAEYLGTDHTELYVSANDALDVIPDLPIIYDEPFSDASQIPTTLVSRLARQHVTVSLSGDGGDELFCGYGHYARTEKIWNRLSILPLSIRIALQSLLPSGALAEGMASESLEAFHRFMNTQWKGFPNLVSHNCPAETHAAPNTLTDGRERLMYADMLKFLPDDILVKVDRAAMSSSLETRAPFLDHRVVELAWQLPIDIKNRNGVGKWPLRSILKKYIPDRLIDRPKMGFGVPMESWLRGPLRAWAEGLLSEDRLRRDGFFDPAAIRSEWKLHLSGKKNRHVGLWTILMFQSWYDHHTVN